MKIVIPMAGRGSRFAKAGYTKPKPLIEILGKPMIAWSIKSIRGFYPEARNRDFIFLILKEHEDKYRISDSLRKIAGANINITFVSRVTEGAACTVLLVKSFIESDEDIVVVDSDQFIVCPDFSKNRRLAAETDWGGFIVTAEKSSPAYSYARTDERGNVLETSEKKQISTHASAGAYYFGKGKYFVRAAEEMIRKNIRFNNEFYLCPVYNEIIAMGKIVRIVPAEFWMTIGTPEEMKLFEETLPRKYL